MASVVGGLTSLVIFYENGGVAFSFIYKIITGGIIVAIGLLPKSPKLFLKEFLAFFGVSLLFCQGKSEEQRYCPSFQSLQGQKVCLPVHFQVPNRA